jgi:PAS domain-containing protein
MQAIAWDSFTCARNLRTVVELLLTSGVKRCYHSEGFMSTDILDALPVAVYTTDADGNITYYNDAAAMLWGHRPELGSSQWCGSWKLWWPTGEPLRQEDCPMAVMLKEGRNMPGIEAVAERPGRHARAVCAVS